MIIAFSAGNDCIFQTIMDLPRGNTNPQSLAALWFALYLLCFRFSVRLSAIMAMNSELVGLPLILLTV